MLIDKTKRCQHCGGTLWLDGDIMKCFMCSRPAGSRSGEGPTPTLRPDLSRKNPFGATKWDH